MTMLAALLLSGIGGFPDCNANGVDDLLDIAQGTSMDCNLDMVPDECQPCLDCDDSGLLDSCEAVAAGGLTGQYWLSDDPGLFSERVLVRIDDFIDFDFGSDPPPGLPEICFPEAG